MSINNIYCSPKVYKELYKKNVGLHTNPDNLSFYLFDKKISDLKFEVIKNLKVQTNFGSAELAIIGSSHYLLLENHFMEILTCSQDIKNQPELILHKKQNEFYFKKDFNHYTYSISVQTSVFGKKEFQDFESALINRKDLFIHAFKKQSAITALHYQNTSDQFLLKTWHTYPDYQKIISSETLLKNRNNNP